jgi:hypothetical protein
MTTSAATCPSAAASGVPSLRSFSLSKASLPRLAAWRPRSFSYASAAPLRIARLALPEPTEVQDELLDLWRDIEDARARRQERHGYNAGHRCWGCRRFIAGPRARCPHCGYEHGGIHHEAYATR